MKKVLFTIAAGAALILAGCNKEADNAPEQKIGKTYTIKATVENPETRTVTSLNTTTQKYEFAWEAGELIGVLPDGDPTVLQFQLAEGSDDTFTYVAEPGAPEYTSFGLAVTPMDALSPAEGSDFSYVDGSDVNYYIQLGGSYTQGQSNAVMVAGAPETQGDGTQKFSFKHLAALVRVTYENIPEGVLFMEFTTPDHPITGTFHFTTVEGAQIVAGDFPAGESDPMGEAWVILPEYTGTIASADFYLPIPTGNYRTFNVQLYDENMDPVPGSQRTFTTTASPFTVARADVVECPTITLPKKGAEWSYVFEHKTEPENNVLTLEGTTTQAWTIAGVGGINVINYSTEKGNQFGTSSIPCTSLSLTTNFGADYYINEIVLNTSGAKDIVGTVSVAVGDNTFVLKGTETTAVSLTSTATDYAFVSAGNVLYKGNVVISYSQTSSKAIYLKSITVNPDPRVDPQLSYAESSYTATVGETFNTPALSYVSGFDGVGLITYSLGEEDDTDVASVNENTGIVTIGTKKGEVTVTASFPGNETYKPAKASYSIVVSKKETYDLFTGPIEEGDYIIVSAGAAMKASISSSRFEIETVDIVNNQIRTEDATIVWHIAPEGDYWTIYNEGEEKYAASTGSNNQGALSSTVNNRAKWSFVYENDAWTISNKDAVDNNKNPLLRRNGTYGFATYNVGTGTAPLLYKLSDGKIAAGISYNPTSDEITYGDALSQPTLNNSFNLTVSYESSNTEVATVNNTASDPDFGKIAVVGVGQAVITASWAEQTIGSNTYRAGSTTFTLTVNGASTTPDWELMNSFSSIVSGDKYMFVNVQNGNSYYMDASTCGVGAGTQCRLLSMSPAEVGFETVDAMCLILTGNTTDGFIVSNLEGKELFIKNTNNGLGFVDEGTTVKFYTDDNVAGYTLFGYDNAATPVIRYIGMNGTTNFRCYDNINNNVKKGSYVWYHYIGQ